LSKTTSIPKGYKQTEVGVIPEDWEESTVGAEFNIQLGKMLDAEKNAGIQKPFLGNRSVQWGRIDLTDIGLIKLRASEFLRFQLRKGDLLVCEGGDVGRSAIWSGPIDECYYQKALHRLRPNKGMNVLLMHYILHKYSLSGFLKLFVTQTSIAHLPKDKFLTIPLALPPTKAEQECIAEALSDADSLIESLETLIAKKRLVKQGAMQELLTGKKRLPGFSGKWERKKLGEVLRFQVGFPFSSAFFNEDSRGLRLVKNRDLKNDGQIFYYSGQFSKEYLIQDGDILIGMDGDFMPCIWSRGSALLNQRIGRLLPKNGQLNPVFAFYFLAKPLKQIEEITSSTTVKHLSHSDIEELELPLPTFQEQSAIAAILSEMDSVIAELEAKLGKARQVKQGMMQELLTGRVRLV